MGTFFKLKKRRRRVICFTLDVIVDWTNQWTKTAPKSWRDLKDSFVKTFQLKMSSSTPCHKTLTAA